MLNLAPYRYEKAMVQNGGPIRKVELGALEWPDEQLYQANAYLVEDLDLSTRSPSVFEQADGCGTHRSLMVARHMAISEALERWALYHSYAHGDRAAYGLDGDWTSCGMAAFPGLFARQARRHALREAVERWCLAEWALGRLPARRLAEDTDGFFTAIEILNPIDRHRVVVCWRHLEKGPYVYGFAAAQTPDAGIAKARIEMERTAVAVRDYHARHPGFTAGDLPEDMDLFERRILYFSLPEGQDTFRRVLKRSTEIPPTRQSPAPIIDRRIPGPWDRYTHVWRVLYPMPAAVHDTNPADVFYW